jgi:hypothetical protein
MRKIFVLTILNLIIPAFFLVILPSIFITTRAGTSITSGSKLLPVTINKPIIFTFVSDHAGLESLSLFLKNPNISNNSLITLDITSPTDSHSVAFYGQNIGDPSTVPLKFTPFTDEPGTTYEVALSTNNVSDTSLYAYTNDSNQPLFQSFYRQSNILKNIFTNIDYQLNQIFKRSIAHNMIYLLTIISLNYFIITHRET